MGISLALVAAAIAVRNKFSASLGKSLFCATVGEGGSIVAVGIEALSEGMTEAATVGETVLVAVRAGKRVVATTRCGIMVVPFEAGWLIFWAGA